MLRDTPVTPYTRLPISTNLTIRRPTTRRQFAAIYGNLPLFTAIYRILLYSTKPTEFY